MADGKDLAAKGRLADNKVVTLQNSYDLSVQENLNDVDEMAKAIQASLYHVASTDENPQHDLCPEGQDSWCGYKRDRDTYKQKNGIPACIVEVIKPIFDDLGKRNLLNKRTHGMTPNTN